MTPLSRRSFLRSAGIGAAVAGLASADLMTLHANPLGLPIGSQTWPHRALIKDGRFAELAATLAGIGVQAVEMCSPIDYEDFAPLRDGKQVKKILADHGLACVSGHFGMKELRTRQAESIAWAHDVGITQMITATLDAGEHPTHGRREARRRRVQQDRRRGGEGGDPAGPPQRGLRVLERRRPPHLRHPLRAARSRAREVPVPDVDHQPGLRRGGLLHEVPWPLLLDARAGRRSQGDGRQGRRVAASAGPRREGQHRLGEDIPGREGWRSEELLRRAVRWT